MISYHALLIEIEQLVANSKNSTNEQHIREQLSAIRALCNVGLANGHKNASTQAHGFMTNMAAQPIQSNPISTQSQSVIQNSSSLKGGKIKEEDANGDSIFDF